MEKTLFKPFLLGRDVHRYSILNNSRVVFFPYEIINSHAEIISIDKIKVDFPLTYKYILYHENEFKSRERGKAKKLTHWHSYLYPKNLAKFEQTKLSSMEICINKPNVTLDNNGYYHTTKVYSWILKPNAHLTYKSLLAIGNSKLLWWFLKNTGDTLQGDARTFKTNYLYPFPTPMSIDDALEKAIVKTVNKRLESSSSNSNKYELLIDTLVYKLYNLTWVEACIIEGNEDWMSKEEYDNYEIK